MKLALFLTAFIVPAALADSAVDNQIRAATDAALDDAFAGSFWIFLGVVIVGMLIISALGSVIENMRVGRKSSENLKKPPSP